MEIPKLLFKIGGVILICSTILFAIGKQFDNGYRDPFYLRLTTPDASSMVIGTSRAAQGIQPKEINSILSGSSYQLPVYNFAFTLGHTSYGPAYYQLIQKKIKKGTRNGLFIVAVDPWAISNSKKESEPEKFREHASFTNRMHFVSLRYNFEYLFKFISASFYHAFISQPSTFSFLHNDGWLEVNPPYKIDDEQADDRLKAKLAGYIKLKGESAVSDTRLEYLKKTIALLKNHGTVVLIRIPADEKMIDLEKAYCPEFDQIVSGLVKEFGVPYFSYVDRASEFSYTDGNHLFKTAGRKFSAILASDIKNKVK